MKSNHQSKPLSRRDKIGIGVVCGLFLLLILFFTVGPVVTANLGRSQMNRLFEGEGMARSDAEPVLKRPYIVYGRDNKGQWQFCHSVYNTQLVLDAGLTDALKDSRACVFVWADTENQIQSSEYYWSGTLNDARFCPVYMRLIDREAGIRYADIKLGAAPIADGDKDEYTYSLYNPNNAWTAFDLDGWLAKHWEK